MQFHGERRPLHPERRDRRRHAVQQRDHADRAPGGHAAQRRQRAGRGLHLRPRGVDRARPARAILPGPPRSATASRRSARTTSSTAPPPAIRSPTGSISNKVAIPQADEQQRLLANLIIHMNAASKPLPRFWYFPHGKKAVVVMTGDDHGNGGTAARFDQFRAASPRRLLGRQLGMRARHLLHLHRTRRSATRSGAVRRRRLRGRPAHQHRLRRLHAGVAAAELCRSRSRNGRPNTRACRRRSTQRHHCIAWSDWSTGAEVQLTQRHPARHHLLLLAAELGRRTRPDCSTARRCRCASRRLDGSLIDVYLAATQMTDESGQTYPFTIDTLLDRALGPEGYYGVYNVNAHTDLDAFAGGRRGRRVRARRAAFRSSPRASC